MLAIGQRIARRRALSGLGATAPTAINDGKSGLPVGVPLFTCTWCPPPRRRHVHLRQGHAAALTPIGRPPTPAARRPRRTLVSGLADAALGVVREGARRGVPGHQRPNRPPIPGAPNSLLLHTVVGARTGLERTHSLSYGPRRGGSGLGGRLQRRRSALPRLVSQPQSPPSRSTSAPPGSSPPPRRCCPTTRTTNDCGESSTPTMPIATRRTRPGPPGRSRSSG